MSLTMGVLEYPIHERTLDNGLRIIISPDHAAPAVAVNIWYDVGSRDEPLGQTGVAHLFEHVMFQGSRNVASGEHLALLQGAGGSVNATTSFDRTNYFETVPTGALDLALWLEADRLATLADNLQQENLDTQRDVVKEEKRQRYDNVPYGEVIQELLALLFPSGHPYGHPTIGTMADLDAFSLTAAKQFFSDHYAPNNAVITLVGDIEPEDGFDRVTKYFGHIPAVEIPQRTQIAELPPLTDNPTKAISADVPADALYLAWRIPASGSRLYDAIDMACDILGGSQASRLHRRLVRFEELTDAAGSATLELVGGNAFAYAFARALDNASLDEIEAVIEEELNLLANAGPTQEEVDRARAQSERAWLSALANFSTRADELSGQATLFGDPNRINTRLAEISTITSEEIQAAAKEFLSPHSMAILRYEVNHD